MKQTTTINMCTGEKPMATTKKILCYDVIQMHFDHFLAVFRCVATIDTLAIKSVQV